MMNTMTNYALMVRICNLAKLTWQSVTLQLFQGLSDFAQFLLDRLGICEKLLQKMEIEKNTWGKKRNSGKCFLDRSTSTGIQSAMNSFINQHLIENSTFDKNYRFADNTESTSQFVRDVSIDVGIVTAR